MENWKYNSWNKIYENSKEFHPDKSVLYNTLAEFETEICETDDQFFD